MNQTKLLGHTLMFADSSLIMGQQLSKWNGHGPILEQDMAMTNIVLDQIGQARLFYQYAATLKNDQDGFINATEDTLAYLRDSREYKNLLLSELPNGDWGQSVLKVFLYSQWQQLIYSKLIYSPVKALSDIAEKSLKEVAYHVRWSSEWVKRLGDGTAESHNRMQKSLEYLWPYTGEMFSPVDYESEGFENADADFFTRLRGDWCQSVEKILTEATLPVPPHDTFMHDGGKTGLHTEYLGYILAEMQFLQRAYPGLDW